MSKNYFLLIFLFLTCNGVYASEIIWEKNVTVRKVEPKCENTYVVAPLQIDLNNADKSQLLKLDGVGPKKAEAIINFRSLHGPFKTVNDLAKIKGFSKKVLTKLIEKNKEIIVVN